jgi:hypothetical protein
VRATQNSSVYPVAKLFYSPTDAQVKCLKTVLKFTLKLTKLTLLQFIVALHISSTCYSSWRTRGSQAVHRWLSPFVPGPSSSSGLYDMIYLLTAIGLRPGSSSTVHIYTQTIHRTIQNKQYIEQHNNFGRVRAVPRLG